VTGDTNGFGSGPFSVNFALYRDCPRLGPSIIPGTAGSAELPDEGEYLVEFVVPPQVDVPLPQSFWIGASFSRPLAGWIGGYPAEIGFSRNRYADPFLGCNALFGASFPETPYSSLNAEVFVREPCSLRFAAYRSVFPERSGRTMVAGAAVADDLHLGADSCQLVAYEFGMRDTGVVKVRLHLDDAGLPGEIIPGSETVAATEGFLLQVVRQEFDPPVVIPRDLWVRAELMEGAGLLPVVAPPPTIGETLPTVATQVGDDWSLDFFPDPQNPAVGVGLHVTLFCDGEAPLGACCDPYLPQEVGDASCRDIPEINCPYPPRGSTLLPKWTMGALCAAQPFDPPCGSFACCRAQGTCEDIPRRECFRNGVSWTEGIYCDGLPQACEFVCVPSFEDCTLPHLSIGCRDPFCCAAVCNADDFCCEVTWDDSCVLAVADLCGLPPANDECAPAGEQAGATAVEMPGWAISDHDSATETEADPGFCCHLQAPGARGIGSVWYRFTASAAAAELSTCASNAPASDSLLQVFSVRPHDADESPCDNLQMVACNDDAPNCSSGNHNSRLCVNNLIPGETYYVLLAAKADQFRGNYRLDIAAGCDVDPPSACPCPVGIAQPVDPPDGVVDARSPRHNAVDGVLTLTALAPNGADRLECWSFCTESTEGVSRELESITAGSNGLTQLRLIEPLDPGSATTLSYTDGLGNVSIAAYFGHPGNVNADDVTNADDAATLVALLDDAELPIYGAYSQDIDRSGLLTPLDLWEQMNVLLGSEMPTAWNNTPIPSSQSCP
jgi:hypothetical protein